MCVCISIIANIRFNLTNILLFLFEDNLGSAFGNDFIYFL